MRRTLRLRAAPRRLANGPLTTAGRSGTGQFRRSDTATSNRPAATSADNRRRGAERRLRARADPRDRPRFAIAPTTYCGWRLCVDTVGAGWTGVGVNRLGPLGLMLFCVEDTGGGVVVVVVVVVVEGFSSPLPPHAAVSPPIAIRAPVPATAARQRTLRDLIVFPIYPDSIPDQSFCDGLVHRYQAGNRQINTVAYICTLQENLHFVRPSGWGYVPAGAPRVVC